jgi:hypothetical protein
MNSAPGSKKHNQNKNDPEKITSGSFNGNVKLRLKIGFYCPF